MLQILDIYVFIFVFNHTPQRLMGTYMSTQEDNGGVGGGGGGLGLRM